MKLITRIAICSLTLPLLSITPVFGLSNGEDATGSPLVVGLVRDNIISQTSCSGALVTPRLVFTAGHCIYQYPASNPQVSWGALVPETRFWVSEPGAAVRMSNQKKLTRIIAQFRDPRYVPSSGEPGNAHGPLYDFAVLVLEEPIGSTNFEVATEADVHLMRSQSSSLLAIGYGLKSATDGVRSADPRPTKTAAQLRTENIIQNNFAREINDRHPGMLLQTRLPENVYMGNGDSGSPLWWQRGEKWVYVGALCCALGRTASTRDSDPIAANPYWAANSAGEYYAAAFFGDVIAAATQHVAENPVVVQTTLPATNRTKVLVCKRGSVTRTVRALKPKCPKSFSAKK